MSMKLGLCSTFSVLFGKISKFLSELLEFEAIKYPVDDREQL